ncbi:MAG TPA: hypothetical protein VKY31_16715 [Terriglobia bacterium]|nr:hypothetical protein [Terriglobia bacterium]
MMPRFEIGTCVRMIGAVAEHYQGITAIVVQVREHERGFAYLTKYTLELPGGTTDQFYEFQLATIREYHDLKDAG